MAGEEAVKKLIHAIMDKRKQLGITDWGQVRIEEVLGRLNQGPQTVESDHLSPDTLEQTTPEQQNDNKNKASVEPKGKPLPGFSSDRSPRKSVEDA